MTQLRPPAHDASFVLIENMATRHQRENAASIPVTIRELQASAEAAADGLATIYLPGGDPTRVPQEQIVSGELAHDGTQEILSLTEDLMLTRMDVRHIPETAHENCYSLQYDGWLFLHFRLDGLSREASPSGDTAMLGRNSFILSASRHGQATTREVLGDSWRTVGIVCQPSFVARELQLRDEVMPEELRRFQAGEDNVDFWYAGEMTNEMSSVANALLHPSVSGSVQQIYLRAKVVELVCLAMDRLQCTRPSVSPTLRLGQYDVACLNRARELLEASPTTPSLGELARQVGLNRSKLAAGFKHVFGMTIGAYHRELRLQLALQALKSRSAPIGRVAEDAGYSDPGSFTKAFKARFDMLPSEVIPEDVTPSAN